MNWLAMNIKYPFVCMLVLMGAMGLHAFVANAASSELALAEGQRIVIIGNTLAERADLFGHWEAKLHYRFPHHSLVVRNLGWSADEIDLRPRSKDFDQHGHELADHRPDILIAMFGFNESFAGTAGLPAFRERFQKFVNEMTTTSFNGDHPPLLIVCSPIPHENLHRRELPDGLETNENVLQYAEVMREVTSRTTGARYVDLYHAMQNSMQDPLGDLTINGIHLNDLGYKVLGDILDEQLFSPADAEKSADPIQWDQQRLKAIRNAVVEKNKQFYYDYRAVNGYYIYGGRKNPYGVINFPAEFEKLRAMIHVRDQRIWDIAAGKVVSAEADDSSTGELPGIESNVATLAAATTPEQSRQKFSVPDGFTVDLVASEVEFPDLQNPVAFQFDNRGRLWVSTMPSYPMYLPGTPPNDKILILEDLNGDGTMDKQTVFADGLHLPIGFVLGDGGAYVSQQPNLVFLADTDGDDLADTQRTILHGFDTADSHHSISAFTWGPGGEMYFQEGTFHHTQVETPYGPKRVKDAAVFRFEPRTERFDVFVSYPFANPWGHCFDRWGQNFVADASPGSNYVGAAFSGDVIYPDKHRAMNQFLVKQWRPTCGCVMVSSEQFPDEMQGNYLLNNTIGFLGTLQYKMRDDGSGFAADPVEPLLTSSDTNFRPVDLKFGPDGALYIVDWFNPLIGHMQHNLRDPNRDKHHGRIWRVRNTNKPLLQRQPIAGEPIENLVPLLGAYEDATRAAARNELRLHDSDQVANVLAMWLESLTGNGDGDEDEYIEHAHLEALWVKQHHDLVDRQLLERVLKSSEPRARAAAIRVLCYWRDRIDDTQFLLETAARDEHPRVRLEAVRAASFLEGEAGREIIAIALRQPLDYYLNYTIGEAMSTLDRRSGSTKSGPDDLVQRLADGLVAQAQLISTISLAAQSADAGQLGRIFNGLLVGPYESNVRSQAIREIASAAAARKIQPLVDPIAMERMFLEAVSSGRDELAAEYARVSGQWHVLGMEASLSRVARLPDVSGDVVQACMNALTSYTSPTGNDAVSALARDPLPVDLRFRASAALVNSRRDAAMELLQSAMAEGTDQGDVIGIAVSTWLQQRDGAKRMIDGLGNVAMSADVAKLALRSLYAVGEPNPELVELFQQKAGISGADNQWSSERKAKFLNEVAELGDPQAGEWIYRRAELNCTKCHLLSNVGGLVGPDLSGVGANSPLDYLLEAILEPSKQVKEAYATRSVLTSNGQIIRGLQVNRDATKLVLRDAEGREWTIAIDDIEQESEGPSLMPEGIQHSITNRELRDLVAFLAVLGKPGKFQVNTAPTVQRYHLLTDVSVLKQLASLPEGELEVKLDAMAEGAWNVQFALVDGKLPLSSRGEQQSIVPESLPLPVILRAEVQVVTPGELSFQVEPQVNVQVVVHGRSVAPNGKEFVELSAGSHFVFLVFEKEKPVADIRTLIIRPEGTQIQFSITGGAVAR